MEEEKKRTSVLGKRARAAVDDDTLSVVTDPEVDVPLTQ